MKNLENYYYTRKFCRVCDEPLDTEMIREHYQIKHIDQLEAENDG